MRLMLGTRLDLHHVADGPLAGLWFRAALAFLGLLAFAVTVLFTVCHGITLPSFRRCGAVSRLFEEHTTRAFSRAALLALILFPPAGSTSLLDQCDLLFVRHAMDVPQMLTATLCSTLRVMRPGSSGGHGRECRWHRFAPSAPTFTAYTDNDLAAKGHRCALLCASEAAAS
jgi:hypothetical protein